MLYSEVPRTLGYKYVVDINYFLGDASESTLERKFYNRLYACQFVKSSDDPLSCVLPIFNNARYIYYLINVKEGCPTDMLETYISKASECVDECSSKEHIAAATMALVYSWLNSDLVKIRLQLQLLKKYPDFNTDKDEEVERRIMELCEEIYYHYSKAKDPITDDIISLFHSLIFKCPDILSIDGTVMPSRIQALFEDIWDPEEAEQGSTQKPNLDDRCSVDDLDIIPLKAYPDIDPDIEPYIGWILERDQAPGILYTLYYYMKGKTKPMDILMPLSAAWKAGVIRKPTWREYQEVFKDYPISTGTLLSNWVDESGIDHYKSNSSIADVFQNLVDVFTNFKESMF